MKSPKIILFIDGPTPTVRDTVQANQLRGKGASVVFRNARYVGGERDGATEPCDGVTGCIPDAYKQLDSADTAIAVYQQAIQDQLTAVEDAGKALVVGGGKQPNDNKGNAGKQNAGATGWTAAKQ